MKSVYIITMHCPLNYGAILQTYGLQKFLESCGLKAAVIDYRPEYIVNDQSLMYIGSEQYKRNILTKWAYRILKAPSKFKRKKYFKTFAKRELILTKEFKNYMEICLANLEADYFLCGSDQIWNVVTGAHLDPSYFLAFVSDVNKRISYAASGNLPITEEVKNLTFPMINKIGHISMREDSTITAIQPFIEKPITHVCDPVFLLECDEWRKLYRKFSTFFPKEKYVLVYPMGNGIETTIDQAYQFSKQMNLPLYNLSSSKRKDFRVDKQLNVDPYTFLSLIDNAEYIITNSFHGTSFSIILEKQFWTCVAEGSNQRITSLLSKTVLESRLLIGNSKPIPTNIIDFKAVKQNLSHFVDHSKNFIKEKIYD